MPASTSPRLGPIYLRDVLRLTDCCLIEKCRGVSHHCNNVIHSPESRLPKRHFDLRITMFGSLTGYPDGVVYCPRPDLKGRMTPLNTCPCREDLREAARSLAGKPCRRGPGLVQHRARGPHWSWPRAGVTRSTARRTRRRATGRAFATSPGSSASAIRRANASVCPAPAGRSARVSAYATTRRGGVRRCPMS